MQPAASAYSKTAQATQSPRELEASILMKAATRLQAIRDDWDGRRSDLDEALTYNRKLWTLLVGSIMEPDHPMPAGIRQNIANLGIFVLGQTVVMAASPEPEGLGTLIAINRELAAGLRGQPAA